MSQRKEQKRLPENLYQYVIQASSRPQIMLTVVSVAVFAMSFIPLELQRRIVNSAIKDGVFEQLLWLCSTYFVVVLLQGAAKYFMNTMRGRISENAMRNIRLRVRAQIERERADDEKAGQTVSLVSSEVEPLGGFIGESISSPLVQVGSLVTVLAYLIWVEPIMALVGVLVFVPQFFFVPPMQRAINARSKERIETLRDVGEVIVEADDSNVTHGAGQGIDFAKLVDQIFRLRISVFRIKFAMKFLINLLNHLGAVSILFVGGWLVIEGRAEVGTIVAFLSGLQQLNEPGRMLVSFFRQLTDARVRYALIRDFFNTNDTQYGRS